MTYTDERCTAWWADRQCTDDAGHPERDGGGHHQFDLTDLGIAKPVLVDLGDDALHQRAEDAEGGVATVRTLTELHLHSVSLVSLSPGAQEPWPGWAMHTSGHEEDSRGDE